MTIQITPMAMQHYVDVYQLWSEIDGMSLDPVDDNEQNIAQFLVHNPSLSYVALIDEKIVGALLCGFDGRRATIYHMAVAKSYRKLGIASALLSQLEQQLKARNIRKARLLAFKSNQVATEFWQKAGWQLQKELNYFSKNLD